ncbi:MAG: 30S ribosomal protein S5 [Nanoarchaeota archaeon]|nr:30S ribosomal protein S5 [Nanoarchaeota archaeon]
MQEENWNPKTELGRQVLSKEIKNIDEILNKGKVILEAEIVDQLLDFETELLLIGQSKGKFGGGQRRVFRQTQKKTKEGNKPRFTTMAVIGDKNGHIGIGYGKSKETVLAREKAIRKAKQNLFVIKRGSGSWESKSSEPHSIPFAVEGKCGSAIIHLKPAPKGTGLCIEKECAKVLELAGIKDIWSKTYGQTKNKINLINALEKALKKLVETKVQLKYEESLSILQGLEKVKDDKEDLKLNETTLEPMKFVKEHNEKTEQKNEEDLNKKKLTQTKKKGKTTKNKDKK